MVRLCIGGDIVNSNMNINSLFSKQLIHIIEQSDIFVFNLEGPIVDEKIKKVFVSKKGPRIFQTEHIINCIPHKNKLFCLANNHIMDYGIEGLENTLATIKSFGNVYTGVGKGNDAYNPFLIEKEKIAIFNVCESGFGMENDNLMGYARFSSLQLFSNIQKYKEKGYTIIVLPHAGAENIEYPLPEIRSLYKYFIDLGADLIIGNHPHVIQGKEVYKNKNIYYSLGNLFFNDIDDGIDLYNPKNLLLLVEISNNKIEINEIFLNKTGNLIDLDLNSEKKNFKKISDFLCDDNNYLEHVTIFCNKVYKEIFNDYINYESGISLVNIKCKIKSIIKIILNKTKIDDDWIIHNYINETNRWIIERAIKEKKNG